MAACSPYSDVAGKVFLKIHENELMPLVPAPWPVFLKIHENELMPLVPAPWQRLHNKFIDALRDLDDCLTMVHLFAALPAIERESIQPERIHNCRWLSLEWQAYISSTHKLRKAFIYVKGIYYQTLLGFMNFKLYESIKLKYPPILDSRLKALIYMLSVDAKDRTSGTSDEESELRLAQLQENLPRNEPGALMNLFVNAAFVSEDDEETRAYVLLLCRDSYGAEFMVIIVYQKSATTYDLFVGVFRYKSFHAKVDWSMVASLLCVMRHPVDRIINFFECNVAVIQKMVLEIVVVVRIQDESGSISLSMFDRNVKASIECSEVEARSLLIKACTFL
ncbi:pescadillo [Tanacetum coccineum]